MDLLNSVHWNDKKYCVLFKFMQNLPSLHLKIFFQGISFKVSQNTWCLARRKSTTSLLHLANLLFFFYSCTFSKTQSAITHFIFEQHRSYVHFHVFNACKMRSFWHIFTPQNWQLDSWDSRSFPSTSSASGVTQISSAVKRLYEILEHSKCPTIP